MSPSSAGSETIGGSSSGNVHLSNIEVERYIGSCLIKNNAKLINNEKVSMMMLHHQKIFTPTHPSASSPRNGGSAKDSGWAGGVPLISMAGYHPRNNGMKKKLFLQNHHNNQNHLQHLNQQHSPLVKQASTNSMHGQQTQLSRLALHTHGVPLILASRYHYRKSTHVQQSKFRCNYNGGSTESSLNNPNGNSDSTTVHNIDTISVASDESSASNNSDNCLPRIIKPRKRRKKDRKLTMNPVAENIHNNDDTQKKQNENDEDNLSTSSVDIPNLTHNFDDVLISSQNNVQCSSIPPLACQCKFCDPFGRIWDIESPNSMVNSINGTNSDAVSCDSFGASNDSGISFSSEKSDCDDQFIVSKMAATALRRSWSDPEASTNLNNSYFYSQDEDGQDFFSDASNVGVIGAGRVCREWHGHDSSSSLPSLSTISTSPTIVSSPIIVSDNDKNVGNKQLITKCCGPHSTLDISTEIVTSHNGHRDLEIKLFSTSSKDREEKCNVLANGGCETSVCWHLENAEEKNCDISYETTSVEHVLVDNEE